MNKFELSFNQTSPVDEAGQQAAPVENNELEKSGSHTEIQPESQTSNQNNEAISRLRQEIIAFKSPAVTTINETSRFNAREVLSSGRERFISYLEKANLRTLISCIEKGGIKIKKIKELSGPNIKSLILLKKREKRAILVNPRLYFLSKTAAASLALEELLKRFNGPSEDKTT